MTRDDDEDPFAATSPDDFGEDQLREVSNTEFLQAVALLTHRSTPRAHLENHADDERARRVGCRRADTPHCHQPALRTNSRSSVGVSQGRRRWIMLWQLEQSVARSVSLVSVRPESCNGRMW